MAKDTTASSRRRAFFREAASRLIAPVADYIEGRVNLSVGQPHLRPPGAIADSLLVETCVRCGACVDVCPADAILPLAAAAGEAAGTPVVDPDSAPCVVCDGLKCTTVCPSGALLPIDNPRDIRMGIAQVYAPLCVRSNREDCTLCVDECPVGEDAIRFNGWGPPEVLANGCVGCGVCQNRCPTSPKAIVVKPL